MNPVAILSPGYPDRSGGVTDHTARLVRNWTDLNTEVHAIGDMSEQPGALAESLARVGVAALLIQYVPFLYGRRGVSTYPERLARDARASGIRVCVFVHEPWVPPTRLPWLVLSPIQRRQLRRLSSECDAVATPVLAWRALLGPRTQLAYVGSTLGVPPALAQPGPMLPAPCVFSPFAAGLNWDWIAAAVRAIGEGLVIVGSDQQTAAGNPVLAKYLDLGWDCRGRLAGPDVLNLLGHAHLVLAPYVDGLTGRRTSAMAALSTGARVLSSTGPLFDPAFRDGPVALAASKSEFVAAAQRLWATDDPGAARAERLALYAERLDPQVLDRQLLDLVTGRP